MLTQITGLCLVAFEARHGGFDYSTPNFTPSVQVWCIGIGRLKVNITKFRNKFRNINAPRCMACPLRDFYKIFSVYKSFMVG